MKVQFTHREFGALTLRELHDILWLRNEVFVVGQKITDEAEVDGLDPQCVHVFGTNEEGKIVAVTRIFHKKVPLKVGRIAVDSACQGRGVGTQMMAYVNEFLGAREAQMSAQNHLRAWYESVGWSAEGEVYDEASIPHIKMIWRGPNR